MEASFYDRYDVLEETHWWFAGRRTILARAIAMSVPQQAGNRILEVGCGTGGVLKVLGGFGTAFGLDSSHAALMHARRRAGSELVCGDSCQLPFATGSFDVVCVFGMLEHVPDDRAAL